MTLRPMTPAMAAALSDAQFRPVIFFEGEFADGVVRLWTGNGTLLWNSVPWFGAGTFLGFSGVEESDQIEANGWSITLSGIPSELGELALAQVIQGKIGRLYLGAFGADGVLIEDPVLMASGRMDVPTIEDGPETSIISITFESRFIFLRRRQEWRWTDESQKTFYPQDRGFEFVTTIQRPDLKWGGK